MAPNKTPSTPDEPAGTAAGDGAPRTGPVRIQPAKMVVSGPPKKGRSGKASPSGAGAATSGAPAAATPSTTPAATPSTRRSSGHPDRANLLASLEAQSGTGKGATTTPVVASSGAAEGLSARRLLLDAAAALAVIGALVLVVGFVLAPRDETDTATATATPAASAPASEAPAASAGSPAPSEAAPTATPEPSATPPSGGYAVANACPDAAECFFYVVRDGDTVAAIGQGLGVTRTGILALNAGLTPDAPLTPGSTVRVPTPATE